MGLKNFKNVISTTFILLSWAGLSSMLAAASTASASATINDAQPNNSPALAAGLVSTTGLNTANTIGSSIGFVASGRNAFAGSINRFALSGQGYTGAAGAAGGNLWTGWVAYSRSNIGFEYTPLNSSGHVNVYLGAVDYTLNSKTIVGVALAGIEQMLTFISMAAG